MLKSAWCRRYGFVDARLPAVPQTRQTQQLRQGWGCQSGPLSHLRSFNLTAHWWIKQQHATLKDKTKTEQHHSNNLCQSISVHSALRRPQYSPSLWLFAAGVKLLQKGANVTIFPGETTVSISSKTPYPSLLMIFFFWTPLFYLHHGEKTPTLCELASTSTGLRFSKCPHLYLTVRLFHSSICVIT